jgi:hypothetical protein
LTRVFIGYMVTYMSNEPMDWGRAGRSP